MTKSQPPSIGYHPKERGPEACYPLSPFPLCGAGRGPLLSDGRETMKAMARVSETSGFPPVKPPVAWTGR